MKKNNIRYVLGTIFLILTLLAIINEYFFVGISKEKKDIESFQEILLQKEELVDNFLENLKDSVKNNKDLNFRNEDYSSYYRNLQDNGIAFFAYQNDSLVIWTDNSVDIPSKYNSSFFKGKFSHSNHGWFFTKQIEIETFKILFLIKIRNDYPYQNSFLRNNFQKDFKISSNVKLVVNHDQGYPILDKSGSYIFSLQPESNKKVQNKGLVKTAVFYILGLLAGLLFVVVFIRDIQNVKLRRWNIIALAFILLSVREMMLNFGVPSVFYSLKLFSPLLYASSYHFASLGDFILNALFIFVFLYVFVKYFSLPSIIKGSSRVFHTTFGLILAGVFVLYYFILTWFKSLLFDSSISFQMYEFSNITIYTFLGYLCIVLLFYAFLLCCDILVIICKENCSLWHYYVLTILSAGILCLLGIVLFPDFKILSWVFPLIVLLIHGLIIYRSDSGFRYSLFIILLIGVSLFLVYCINDFSSRKERKEREITTINLAAEYDPASEALLPNINNLLINDEKIKKWCKNPFVNEQQIIDYIQNTFFKGYWEQFLIQTTICGQMDDLRVEPDGQIRNCFEFFTEMITESGNLIPETNFYFLDIFDGMVSYLGKLEFSSTQFEKVNIYIRIDSRISDEGLGYPDLLLDEKFNRMPIKQNYSYAKYKNGNLIASSGSFNYFLESERFGGENQKYTKKVIDGYNHLTYRFGQNSIVVSAPTQNWYNRFITFPYIFVFFYLFTSLIWIIEKYPWHFTRIVNFKYRIQYSLVGVLMLFFFLLGGGSVYYNIEQFKDKHNKQLSEKLELVKRGLLENVYSEEQLDEVKNPFLIDRLRRFSNLIYADINIYNLKGELLVSSRPEIFEKGLLGKQMSYKAYNELFYQKRAQFIHQEKMGEMEYLSAYETIVDEKNRTVAFLNLPYFMRNQELQEEMFNLIIAGVNLHLFMILLAIFLSVIISNKITYPLKLIQDKFKKTRFGTKSEQINYTKNDEIGSLVTEYNRMLTELEDSAELLARSERESAWREMARQIAHEIKNPLTPMKLNIQFLQKSWKEKVPDWDKYMDRVSKTLIEQIDNLSAIASAFSDFAKMPQANNERVNLVDVIKRAVQLFKNDALELNLNLNQINEAWVFIDKKQAARVYVNLINNAIQSIPEGQPGQINVALKKEANLLVTVVNDNGIGISDEIKEKLFVPNFTTKSGGMGLGLAIVKNIVENAGGSIRVESEIGKGSSFFVSFPEMI